MEVLVRKEKEKKGEANGSPALPPSGVVVSYPSASFYLLSSFSKHFLDLTSRTGTCLRRSPFFHFFSFYLPLQRFHRFLHLITSARFFPFLAARASLRASSPFCAFALLDLRLALLSSQEASLFDDISDAFLVHLCLLVFTPSFSPHEIRTR